MSVRRSFLFAGGVGMLLAISVSAGIAHAGTCVQDCNKKFSNFFQWWLRPGCYVACNVARSPCGKYCNKKHAHPAQHWLRPGCIALCKAKGLATMAAKGARKVATHVAKNVRKVVTKVVKQVGKGLKKVGRLVHRVGTRIKKGLQQAGKLIQKVGTKESPRASRRSPGGSSKSSSTSGT